MGNQLILTHDKYMTEMVKHGRGFDSACFFNKLNGQDWIDGGDEFIKRSNGQGLHSVVIPASENWEGSAGQAKLLHEIEDLFKKIKARYERRANINQFPDDYYDLINKIRIDITRRRMQTIDYTGIVTNEIINYNFSKSVDLTEFLPFAGKFKKMMFTGDSVSLLQQKTGAIGSVGMHAYGLGHARSFEDELYNLDIFDIMKVNDAVARAHVNERNDLVFAIWIWLTDNAGWVAAQQQPAITTEANYDQNLYQTIKYARRKLLSLKDAQTGQTINPTQINLLVGTQMIAEEIDDVIRGQLNGYGAEPQVRKPLGIDNVQIYKGDTVVVGTDTFTFKGVAEDKAYLYVPASGGAPNYTLTKRPLFQETGRGDVFQFIHEKRAWGFVQGKYVLEFLGSSDPSNVITDTSTGWIVEIDLPPFIPET